MESEDYAFYQGLVYLMDNNVEHLGYDLTFSTEVSIFYSLVWWFFTSHCLHVTCIAVALCALHINDITAVV